MEYLHDRYGNSLFEERDEYGHSPAHWMALAPIARTLLPGDSPELTEKLDLIAEKTVETGIGAPDTTSTGQVGRRRR